MINKADEQLISGLKSKDPRALELFAGRYFDSVSKWVKVLGGKCEEDIAVITNSVFINAVNRINGFRGASSLATWLHKVARTTTIDHYRQVMRESAMFEPLDPDRHSFSPNGCFHKKCESKDGNLQVKKLPIPPQQGSDGDLARRQILWKMIDRLPAIQKRVFYLRRIECRTSKETGEILGKEERAIIQCFYRAMTSLRAMAIKERARSECLTGVTQL